MNTAASLHRYELVALKYNYPATLFGFLPREQEYWNEPLAWASELIYPERQGLDPAECQRLLNTLVVLRIWNENMAPRFRVGSCVAGERLQIGEEIKPGDLLAWYKLGNEIDEFLFARVQRWDKEGGILYLGQDNGGQPIATIWKDGYASHAYRITHYVNQQVPPLS